ncbi:MAG: hypothetical protein AAGF47_04550 [Planctomycetota bacterium]
MHRRCFAAGSLVLAAAINAQPAPPDYGFDFVTIGDAGNIGSGVLDPRGNDLGAVGYDFRLTRNELTTSDLSEFYRA